MSKRVQSMLIVPDTHAPYENKRAWRLMIKVAKDLDPDIIVHMGDLADCYTVSSHSKNPLRKTQLSDELKAVRKLRKELDSLGATRKVFIEGNHEDRLRRYLQDKAPELFDVVDIDSLLELSDNGWEFVPYKDSIKIGGVYFTHDTGGSGKYTTGRALDEFASSVVIGHHHSQAWIVSGDATGAHHVGAQFGWLGDIDTIDYMHKIKANRKWSLGFGIGHLDSQTGNIYFTPMPIIDYQTYYDGKVYSGR